MLILIPLFFASAMAVAAPALPVVVALKGDVQVLTETGENARAMLYEGKRYYYHKARIGEQMLKGALVVCGGDARAKLVYPSGTSVWVGSGTMLKIVEADGSPSGERSILDLVYGRIRALVTPTKKWEVRTSTVVDGVRGTDFLVSYSKLTGSETSVMSGRVEVQSVAAKAEKREAGPDQTAHETAAGEVKVEGISKVQVLTAFELTSIKAEAKPERKVAELETRSHDLLVKEIGSSHPEVFQSAEFLNRTLAVPPEPASRVHG